MTATGQRQSDLDVLLEHIKQARGFDFTGYKRSSLERRITKRMEQVGAPGYREYLEHLEVHAGEFNELFNTILINVTAFFRDAPYWDYVRKEVIPQIVAGKPEGEPIRIWSAACAAGQEAYSAAIAFAEHMGEDEFLRRVKIYATDVDEDALAAARAGVYEERDLEGLVPEQVDRFFVAGSSGWSFRPELRRSVIFGRNDLVRDAPISRIDLLLCRNVLMYFTAETQERILRRLHFALDAKGVLFLGKSEMLLTRGDIFAPLDVKRRVFRKVPKADARERPRAARAEEGGDDVVQPAEPMLLEAAFDAIPAAQVVIAVDGRVLIANAEARSLLSLTTADIGRELKDLELSYRPLELRGKIEQATRDRTTLTVSDVVWTDRAGQPRSLDVEIRPLVTGDELAGTSVVYRDVSGQRALERQLETARTDLETAYEELESTVEELETTNEELQSTNEELETTNEELQSTNEELETTNEELQSTNEELETMNEELQSTNEELETMNDELQVRTGELHETNGLLETILSTMGVAVAVLDTELRVRIWNKHAEEMWGLTLAEVLGQHFLNLDIGLPVEELRQSLRATLAGEDERADLELDAHNRRGQALVCAVVVLPLRAAMDGITGAILLMERHDAES